MGKGKKDGKMDRTLMDQYHTILENIEENLPYLDIEAANETLEAAFIIKPVRLKWYLVKAKLMLKENRPVDEIIKFLSNKCVPCYLYDYVDEYFELMSFLSQIKGDYLEEQRYLYQLQKMKKEFQGVEAGSDIIEKEIERLQKELAHETVFSKESMEELAHLYYISGNIYLYLLWVTVAKEVYGSLEKDNREWILEKLNVEYYFERLTKEGGTFVVIMTSSNDELQCMLTAKALKTLGKKVFVLNKPMIWEKNCNKEEVALASIESIEQKDGIQYALVYSLQIENGYMDTRGALLEYIAEKGTENGLATVLASGLLIDQMAMEKEMKPRLERLTESDADYLEENIAVGRFGNYLAYIGNIYKTSKEEVERALYKKPSCRFSLIIPCRNAGETLYYTLKTCLNQSFQGDYEVIVSDNTDMAVEGETPTYKICQRLQDKRIKYYRTPRNLSLMKNFEYAYLKSEGEFLISMGADDGILPWALEELNLIIENDPNRPIWLWHEAFYKWSDVDERLMPSAGNAILVCGAGYKKGSPGSYFYSPKKVFMASFSEFEKMYFLPQLYHNSGIHRSYLATLYEKTGVLWAGYSQDICMAVTIANVEEELGFIENVFTITGISNVSIGANCRVGNNDLEQVSMIEKMKKTFVQGWRVPGYLERLFPIVDSQIGGLYACILYAHGIGAVSDDVLEGADWRAMYERVLLELDKRDILFDAKIHRLRYAMSLCGEELVEWFDQNMYGQLFMPEKVVHETEEANGTSVDLIQIEGKPIEAEPGSVCDVYQASLFLEKFFTGGNRE